MKGVPDSRHTNKKIYSTLNSSKAITISITSIEHFRQPEICLFQMLDKYIVQRKWILHVSILTMCY